MSEVSSEKELEVIEAPQRSGSQWVHFPNKDTEGSAEKHNWWEGVRSWEPESSGF